MEQGFHGYPSIRTRQTYRWIWFFWKTKITFFLLGGFQNGIYRLCCFAVDVELADNNIHRGSNNVCLLNEEGVDALTEIFVIFEHCIFSCKVDKKVNFINYHQLWVFIEETERKRQEWWGIHCRGRWQEPGNNIELLY